MRELMRTKATFVPPSGPLKTKIAIVGEQPGRIEVRVRKPFEGPAGKELTTCLQAAMINRHECYITNVIKDLDHPLEKYITYDYRKGCWTSPGFELYRELLANELSACDCNVIIALGNVALYTLTGNWGITKWRGSLIESDLVPGKKVIPTFHPATIIPPKCQYLNKHLIIFDLKKAMAESEDKEFNYVPRRLRTRPSFDEVMAYLERVLQHGLAGNPVDYDIEVLNLEISCLSFALGPCDSMSIPFLSNGNDYFTLDQEIEVMKKIALILEHPLITIRGQNLLFDAHFTLARYGIRMRNVVDGKITMHDTMIAQGTLYPDYAKGLDFICSMYTDIPYYKDDGKTWFRGGDWEKYWRYNCLDSIVCSEAHPQQIADLKKHDNLPAYERQVKLIEPLCYMQQRGIRVDLKGMEAERISLEKEAEEKQELLNKLAGQALNPNSPKQLQAYFYGKKKFPPYKDKGTITTNELAMKRIARQGCPEATLVLDIRRIRKLASTYMDVNKVDEDGRIRCSYNPVGTRYSRLSSSASIFGTGTNLQNWPHPALRFLLADEDYVVYTQDLSQAENRIVAYVGRIPQMMEAFESGIDVHSLTASLIFRKPISEVSDEEGSCILGDGTKSERFWGKKANHGLNYDLGYKRFALYYEIPERDAKVIVEGYHRAYPGVRQNYHAGIKAQLRNSRILTNLMGRKTLFLDDWGDSLFKEAYSCIPQGSTGDKINEQGLIFVYYNQDLFGPVELLTQVHDSISYQIPVSVGWKKHAEIISAVKESLEQPFVTSYGQPFKIPVDTVMGLNFYKEEGIEMKAKKWPSTVDELAALLEQNYAKLTAPKE